MSTVTDLKLYAYQVLLIDLNSLKVPELKTIASVLGKENNKLIKAKLIEYVKCIAYMVYNDKPMKSITKPSSLPLVPEYCKLHDFNGNWRQHLVEHGWATVKIPNFDSVAAVQGFLQMLHKFCPSFDPNNTNTWYPDNMPPNFRGVFTHYVGHEEWIWKVREACYPIFSQIWQTNDLLTSFDGCCLLHGTYNNHKNWLHCDQGRLYRNMCCIQGLVNLLDNGPHDGGLVLIPKSRDYFSEYLDDHMEQGWDGFYPIDYDDHRVKQSKVVKVCGNAGEIFLWDSRIFHCNVPPVNHNSVRMCTYVCMLPTVNATPDIIQKRIKFYEEGRMTSHWPYGEFFRDNGKHPHNRGKQVIKIEQPVIAELNPLRSKLIGY